MEGRRVSMAKRSQTLADELYYDILNSILGGEFKLHRKLPTEAVLAHDYGVSRTTVRSALAHLKREGYVASRQGSGSVVVKSFEAQDERVTPIESLADLERCFECRISLEGEIAYYVAQRRSDEVMRLLDAHLRKMQEILALDQVHTNEDTEFHILLARSCGNRLFETMIASIRPHILFGMNISKTLSKDTYRRHARQSFEEHKLIVDAIRHRADEAARDAMRAHIRRSRDRIFNGS